MDRFFSKLDLRDIKIDPEKSRFSPDDELDSSIDYVGQPIASADGATITGVIIEEPQILIQPDGYPAVDGVDGGEHTDEIALDGNRRDSHAHYEMAPDGHASDVLKVSSRSRPSAVAGAIAGVVRELGRAEVQAIGAGATNQAIKAVAIARDYLLETGIDVVCLPAFIDITIDNEDRTAIRLVIEPR